MAAEIITKEDLNEFRERLLADIKGLLGNTSYEPIKWLKSYQVKNLLKISLSTTEVNGPGITVILVLRQFW